MSPQADNLVEVAREYCAFIDTAEEGMGVCLDPLRQLLVRLHAAIEAVDTVSDTVPPAYPVDLDQRFELFSRLRRLLGSLDGYWLEFDVAQDGQEMSGSLADDLTDIYCELKLGLRRLDVGRGDPMAALGQLRSGFRIHWGQHLVDAERHLYSLSARGALG